MIVYKDYRFSVNQLFTSAQHLLLLIIGPHVSTDHSVILRSLICWKFQRAVHTFGIPIVFTLKPFISVNTIGIWNVCTALWNLQHIKDLRMTEWSVETCSPIISSNKCCADVNNWWIVCLSTSWCIFTNYRFYRLVLLTLSIYCHSLNVWNFCVFFLFPPSSFVCDVCTYAVNSLCKSVYSSNKWHNR